MGSSPLPSLLSVIFDVEHSDEGTLLFKAASSATIALSPLPDATEEAATPLGNARSTLIGGGVGNIESSRN